MGGTNAKLPIGQQVSLPGHFALPITLEAAHPVAQGYACHVRLPDGTVQEIIITPTLAKIITPEAASQTVSDYLFTASLRAQCKRVFDDVIHRKGQGFWVQAEYGAGKTHFLSVQVPDQKAQQTPKPMVTTGFLEQYDERFFAYRRLLAEAEPNQYV
jgi:hypothetical protein